MFFSNCSNQGESWEINIWLHSHHQHATEWMNEFYHGADARGSCDIVRNMPWVSAPGSWQRAPKNPVVFWGMRVTGVPYTELQNPLDFPGWWSIFCSDESLVCEWATRNTTPWLDAWNFQPQSHPLGKGEGLDTQESIMFMQWHLHKTSSN